MVGRHLMVEWGWGRRGRCLSLKGYVSHYQSIANIKRYIPLSRNALYFSIVANVVLDMHIQSVEERRRLSCREVKRVKVGKVSTLSVRLFHSAESDVD